MILEKTMAMAQHVRSLNDLAKITRFKAMIVLHHDQMLARASVLEACADMTDAHLITITGPAGAGKSAFVDGNVRIGFFRAQRDGDR
ncbi:hypothetical protein [Paraburkholderia caribensis]|uniref:hypothetical protein n=1 Tax=Paraburkholderia caribensis TaxID=75105 RepID=UPI001590A374|nr:hypothetical protein [Paraburkholderia caribensis]